MNEEYDEEQELRFRKMDEAVDRIFCIIMICAFAAAILIYLTL